jgi:uncharacterized protein (TIGR00369 family)
MAEPHLPPFYTHLGLCPGGDGDPGVTVGRREEILNSHGALHGGAVMGLLDAALSRAIRLHLNRPVSMATIDMSVHFVAPATGASVRAEGTVIRAGSSVAYAQATARTEDGTPVAVATGAFRIFGPRTAPAAPTS